MDTSDPPIAKGADCRVDPKYRSITDVAKFPFLYSSWPPFTGSGYAVLTPELIPSGNLILRKTLCRVSLTSFRIISSSLDKMVVLPMVCRDASPDCSIVDSTFLILCFTYLKSNLSECIPIFLHKLIIKEYRV